MSPERKQKVICVGLGRTGVSCNMSSTNAVMNIILKTLSLRTALDMLGFGPCYHMKTLVDELDGKDFPIWHKFAIGMFGKQHCFQLYIDALIIGEGTIEEMDAVLHDYGAVLDYPPAMYYAELYATYPDAKFILVRPLTSLCDPAC